MNYDGRKGIPSLYRVADKRKQERVSVGSKAKQLKVMRNTLTTRGSVYEQVVWNMSEVV